MTVIILDLDSL